MKNIFLPILLAATLGACTKKPEAVIAEKSKSIVKLKDEKKSVYEPALEDLLLIFGEAEGYYREVLRISKFIGPEQTTFFYKLQRAIGKLDGVKLSSQSVMGCEQYKFDFFPQNQGWTRAIAYEVCLRSPQTLLEIQAESFKGELKKIKLKVKSEPIKRLIGLGASLASIEASCDIMLQQRRIAEIQCKNLAQQKLNSDEILKIDKFQLQNVSSSIMAQITGTVYVNLSPLRKFEMKIPLTGKIKIVETELFPPEDLIEESDAAGNTQAAAVSQGGNKSSDGGKSVQAPPAAPHMGIRGALNGSKPGQTAAPNGGGQVPAQGVQIPGSSRPAGVEFGPGEQIPEEEEFVEGEENGAPAESEDEVDETSEEDTQQNEGTEEYEHNGPSEEHLQQQHVNPQAPQQQNQPQQTTPPGRSR